MAKYLKSQRTTTVARVDRVTAVHDSRDLTPDERAAILAPHTPVTVAAQRDRYSF
jgi:hypothetical protein